MTDKNFFTKLPYLILISLISLGFWAFKLDYIGIPIFVGIIFVLAVFVKNTIYIIPFLLNILFMVSQVDWDTTSIPLSLYIAPAALLIALIVHIIRFKVNIFRGKFFIGLSILVIGMIISQIINSSTYDLNFFLVIVASLLYVFIYGFFANTLKGDNLRYLIRIFVILGVMISAQVMIYYLRVDDIIIAIESKSIDLGWGISNFIATYLIMFIASMTYFVKKYKLHLFWIILFLFEIAMLFFTLSRAGILAFLATSVLLIVFMFVKYEHKWNLLLNLVIGVLIMSIIGYFAREYFIAIWDRLEVFRVDDNGRIELWYEAIDVFKANPIFGAGVYARSTGLNELRMFHNTVLHVLACFGVIGGIALLVQFVSILRVFLYKFSQKKAILLIALIGANIHGLVDNTYLMPQYMIIMLIMIAIVENGNKVDKLRSELRLV